MTQLYDYQIPALLDIKINVISQESSNQEKQETHETFLHISKGLDTIQVGIIKAQHQLTFLQSMPLQKT